MKLTQEDEIWRQVPPEEKLQLIASAQSKGVLAALTVIVIAGTLAVGFKWVWIFWGSFAFSPIIFQAVSSKAWRALRPKSMLEYLAARSAARRYAFTSKSKELDLVMLFKGHMEEEFSNEQLNEALEATIANTKEAEVWIALFRDAVVLMCERAGGAQLKFGEIIGDKFTLQSSGASDKAYTSNKEVVLSIADKAGMRRVKLTSQFPAALIVFEKKFLQLKEELRRKKQELPPPIAELPPVEAEEHNFNLF